MSVLFYLIPSIPSLHSIFFPHRTTATNIHHDLLLENLLIVRKLLIHSYIEKAKTAKGTNWEQKFQKPQNENICLTNLNVENNGNFPILAFGDGMERNLMTFEQSLKGMSNRQI